MSVAWIPLSLISGLIITGACGLFPLTWPVVIPYLVYNFIDKTPEQGGRKWPWLVRNCPILPNIRNYFSMKLIRTVELNPSENYIFAYHPHGIIGYGAQAYFNEENPEFISKFPGIDLKTVTLNVNFKWPLFRDLILGLGYISCSKKSITRQIEDGPGKSILIVIGGSHEALYSGEDSAKLIVRSRLGFIKMAIKTGANLVPIYSFGENSLFKMDTTFKENSILKSIQYLVSLTGLRVCLFHGRGIFQSKFGVFPMNYPITMVTGEPVKVTQNDNPSEEEIKRVQTEYLKNLTKIYNNYKDKYHVGSANPPELEFI
ncbi:diacylglycerol acyltransferase [Conidiobolus coronatus NRRL 28638]|uniref:Diacylglycerol O-acyltransferase n=1 Tax=Conidiobolus coronatus (strain ATCC 28846 / CBS 209.66 / NRRL 28638) TaxID=796925 RepID=A0A137NYL3_CONC2|nr:diacylglycerol acyltransferase [Conidiobolus coronatus NRRL 28638]|eukprot:KXN67832.1 diacylglycerol acyltransferase [Conidiobolus coronatus NRRL 28638]